MPYAFIRIKTDGALAQLAFAREKGLNVLSTPVLEEIKQGWKRIEASDARVCIIRGEGKAFLAGADIKEMVRFDAAEAASFSALGQSVFDKIERSGIVSVAALHGACMGGGCELALACDIRVGAQSLSIGQPEVNIGLVPGFGGSQRLPRIVGLGWALRMILSGEPLNAAQALQCGLITETGPDEDLAQRAEKLAQTILSRGPHALRIAKRLVRLGSEYDAGMKAERESFGLTFGDGEAKAGLSAFVEKRPPVF
jgi:enoyl-CoA hydratase